MVHHLQVKLNLSPSLYLFPLHIRPLPGEVKTFLVFITLQAKVQKKKIEKSKSKTQKAGQEQRHETKAQGHKQTQPADSLIQPRAHSDCAHLGLAELP